MSASTSTTHDSSALLNAADQAVEAAASDWLKSLRQRGRDYFATLGLPTTRHEEWRFTNIAPLAKTSFVRPTNGLTGLTAADLNAFSIEDLDAYTVVFVNGRYAEHLSDLPAPSDQVVVTSLSNAIDRHESLVRPHLGALADDSRDAFAALNTAMMDDGLFVYVGTNAQVDKPIHMICLTSPHDEPAMVHPRSLIIAEDNAQAAIIEHAVCLRDDDTVTWTNAVTEIIAGPGANVEHYLLEEESLAAYNISTLATRQGRDSNVASHTVLRGGALVRNNVNPILDGEGSNCLINGLYLPRGQQHMDNHMRVEHAKPHGDSRQFYKGVLSDKARGVFSGRIVVAPGAQKTDAKQTNANLLLSPDAQINTKPQLEIYADDVKCTHGATIGEIDENAVFYLRARGVSEAAARAMLVYAFAAEGLFRMKLAPVRRYVERLLVQQLPGGDTVANLL